MTITYPRSFPFTSFVAGCEFKLTRQIAVNQTYNGAQTSIELADPVWVAKYMTIAHTAADRAAWQAWFLSLKESTKTFYGYDPEKPYPFAYGSAVTSLTRHGGGAFDGTATLVSTTTSTISVNTLPDSYVATVGDMISIPMPSSQRSLHQIMETATGDTSGALTVSVEPPVRSGALTTAGGVQLVKPTAIMVVRPGTFSAPIADAVMSPVSFEAVQQLV